VWWILVRNPHKNYSTADGDGNIAVVVAFDVVYLEFTPE
jgi:hypothetical protein